MLQLHREACAVAEVALTSVDVRAVVSVTCVATTTVLNSLKMGSDVFGACGAVAAVFATCQTVSPVF